MSQFFTSGGQSIGVSASASALPMDIQDLFPLGWSGWISLQSKGVSKVFSNTTVQKHQFFSNQVSLWKHFSHPHVTTGKAIALTRWTFIGQVMSLLFNMLSRLVIAFLPRSKRLLISWLQSPSAVILETKKITSITVAIFSPSICQEVTFLASCLLINSLTKKRARTWQAVVYFQLVFSFSFSHLTPNLPLIYEISAIGFLYIEVNSVVLIKFLSFELVFDPITYSVSVLILLHKLMCSPRTVFHGYVRPRLTAGWLWILCRHCGSSDFSTEGWDRTIFSISGYKMHQIMT